ncbi:MAG: EAL domain-containing protein [Actinomycetota bacterium]|nr:EAL domain-containing protein [Actinomycetota bacterium]
MGPHRYPRGLDVALDAAILVVGVALFGASAFNWLSDGHPVDVIDAVGVGLIVLMARYPVVLPQRGGDAVIGFEISALVFLTLTRSPAEALVAWCVGQLISQSFGRRSMRSRLFNVGVTALGGGLFVGIVSLGGGAQATKGLDLLLVSVACAAYFLMDLIVTAGSLALESHKSLDVKWGSALMPLLVFVAVSTMGFLAALLLHSAATWTLGLLLVPVATILVAVRSVSESRLAQMRLGGLLDAATRAPDWADPGSIERTLIEQAERVLRHTVAELRDQPPGRGEIGHPLEVPGRPACWLVARPVSSAYEMTVLDGDALAALTALASANLSQRQLTDEMAYQAQHDLLTGLPNRALLGHRLESALSTGNKTSVLYCDLDGFKAVNDRFGHDTGDELLVAVADRLRQSLRARDLLARLGGDEFAVVVSHNNVVQAEDIAARLLESLQTPFLISGNVTRIQASIGIAHSGDERTASDLMREADMAMYRAKGMGKNRIVVFEPSLRSETLYRLEMEDELRQALAKGQIQLNFQPLVDLVSGKVLGFEALARWEHETLGQVSPAIFVPLAEQVGLMSQLGSQVMELLHSAAADLQHASETPLSLSVNVSPIEVCEPRLLSQVRRFVDDYPDIDLVVELTESVLLGDDLATSNALEAIAACGARLAVDDFGVGYSSIGYLQRFPVRLVKIDKSYVQTVEDPRTRKLVQGVVAMCHAMGLTVVAEGIETADSADMMRDLGCRVGQGFSLSRPLTLADAVTMAARGTIGAVGVSVVPGL